MTMLKYVAGLDSADNKTGRLRWTSNAIGNRCGVTSASSGSGVLTSLRDAGLIEQFAWVPGRGYDVLFTSVKPSRSLRLPLAALWKAKGRRSEPSTLRYGKDTAQVLRWLLVELCAGDWDLQGWLITSEMSASDKCDRTAVDGCEPMAERMYERAWQVVRRVCANDPWIEWERTYTVDGGRSVYRVSIDWRKLPAMQKGPSQELVAHPPITGEVQAVTPPVSGGWGPPPSVDGGGPVPVEGVSQFLSEPIEEEASSSSPVLSSPVLPLQSLTARPQELHTPMAQNGTGGTERGQTPLTPSVVLDVLQHGKRTVHACAGYSRKESTDYNAWLLCTVAWMVDFGNKNQLALSASDVQELHPLLRGQYEAGWMPGALASALTRWPAPDRSPLGALRYRIGHLGDVPNAGADDETVAYLTAASSRSAAKYDGWTL